MLWQDHANLKGEIVMFSKIKAACIAAACGVMLMTAVGLAGAQDRDCSKAPNAESKAQCEARNAASAKCGKLVGDARRICQRDALPRDCAKSDNKARCESEVAAHKACRGDAKTYRSCFEGKMKK